MKVIRGHRPMLQRVGPAGLIRRGGSSKASTFLIAAPTDYTFQAIDQPAALPGMSIDDTATPWTPDDILIWVDFETDTYFWDGETKLKTDLIDNLDGTYDIDLATPLDFSQISGFVDVTNVPPPVINQGVLDFWDGGATWVSLSVQSDGGLRWYDSVSAQYAIAVGDISNTEFFRFRTSWNMFSGDQQLIRSGYLGSSPANNICPVVPACNRVGIGYRRRFSDLPFSGTIHRFAVLSNKRNEDLLLQLNQYAVSNRGVHWIGDSFLNAGQIRNEYDAQVRDRNQYFFSSIDQVGGANMAQHADRFEQTPEYYGQTLVVLDGIIGTSGNVEQLNRIVSKLKIKNWVYVQSNPTYPPGQSTRPDWDREEAALLEYCGPDHYIETKSVMQANATPGEPDDTDLANDIWPTSLRSDDLHPNEAGNAILADLVYGRGVSTGWLTYTANLETSSGVLSVSATTNATKTGNGTSNLRVSGNEADVNAELATLTIDGASVGTHTISLSIFDPNVPKTVSTVIDLIVT